MPWPNISPNAVITAAAATADQDAWYAALPASSLRPAPHNWETRTVAPTLMPQETLMTSEDQDLRDADRGYGRRAQPAHEENVDDAHGALEQAREHDRDGEGKDLFADVWLH